MRYEDSEQLVLIGGGGGVSQWMWQMQLQTAPSYSCGRFYHYGAELADRPVHQHCTAEGIKS